MCVRVRVRVSVCVAISVYVVIILCIFMCVYQYFWLANLLLKRKMVCTISRIGKSFYERKAVRNEEKSYTKWKRTEKENQKLRTYKKYFKGNNEEHNPTVKKSKTLSTMILRKWKNKIKQIDNNSVVNTIYNYISIRLRVC